MKEKEFSYEELISLLSFDAERGEFYWRTPETSSKKYRGSLSGKVWGRKAGYINTSGYVVIMYKGVNHCAHRLAWLYHYKEPAAGFLDHINRNKADNRIENLRLATITQNAGNQSRHARNTSGFKGVSLDKRCQRLGHKNIYEAYIMRKNRKVYLGRYPTAQLAHAAYKRAAKEYFGEFFCAG